jgi:hypothetical protein
MSLSSPLINVGITSTETIADATLSTTGRNVQHTQFNETITPDPAVIYSGDVYALDTGAATIDLRALRTVAGGEGDGNGMKVQGFYFKNLGANPMTITQGASNPYLIFGTSGSVIVPPGASFSMAYNDASADVSGTVKTIDIAGTGSQQFRAAFLLG